MAYDPSLMLPLSAIITSCTMPTREPPELVAARTQPRGVGLEVAPEQLDTVVEMPYRAGKTAIMREYRRVCEALNWILVMMTANFLFRKPGADRAGKIRQ